MHLIRAGAIMGFEAMVFKKGHNPIHLLEQVGMSSAQLRDPNNYVSYIKLADLLHLASQECADPCFGLRLAATQTASVTGELAFSIGMQPTIGDSLNYAKEHLRLHAEGAHLEEQLRGGNTRWRFYLDFNNASGLQQLLQMSIGQIANAWLLGGDSDRRFKIHLEQHKPPVISLPVTRYQPYLVFESDLDGIEFPSSWSSRKLDLDPEMVRDYFQQRVKLLEDVYPYSLPERLKHLMSGSLASGECNLDRMAAALNVHPRVLQKRLKKAGTSFSQLLQQTRMLIACQQLQNDYIGITDLALKLGYAEVAIFSRNFKRWFGLSPRQWRQQHQSILSASIPHGPGS